MVRNLRIAHLYPELLNLYADKGNILTLRKRCLWRGIDVEICPVPAGSQAKLAAYHMVLLGGGSDREQEIVGRTLLDHQSDWRNAVESGLPVLAVCGGYQLLGEFYQLPDGTKVPGLELLDMETQAGTPRLIGNVAISSPDCGTIVGFENHAGRTTHRHKALGTVISGHGNNGKDKAEGVHYKNVIGTYIHGPLLPKNPRLADFVIATALAYAGLPNELEPLPDELEAAAHSAFLQRRIPVTAVKDLDVSAQNP